eukprot:COSAG02_NODE_1817_length_10774_cov_19.773489_4_plen_66_part_00
MIDGRKLVAVPIDWSTASLLQTRCSPCEKERILYPVGRGRAEGTDQEHQNEELSSLNSLNRQYDF